jgi:prepilin-type N-terminal cleavage/methylation domain-containing protein
MNSSVHSKLLKTHAFTLVELLVVIAIQSFAGKIDP